MKPASSGKGRDLSILKLAYFNICANFKQILPAQPCLLCAAPGRAGMLCETCTAALPWLQQSRCPVCALPTLHSAVCGQCLQHPPHFSRTVAAFAYDFPLDKLVLALKYGEKLHLATLLADQLAQGIDDKPDCIVAMPLHPQRLRERGFNQSLQLARRLSRQLQIPLLANDCQRVRNTPSQSTLPWKERNKNMRKAFSCTSNVAGKHVAIVDDVMTTGATLDELAATIIKAGATRVSAWVVARTLPHSGNEARSIRL